MLATRVNPCEGRLGARLASVDGHPFFARVEPHGPAAACGIAPGDYIVSVDDTPTPNTLAAMDALKARLDANTPFDITLRRSDLAPNEDAFARYCDANPASRANRMFQMKHRHIGGWCTHTQPVWMPRDVLPCDGCPECLFGAAFADLTTAQANEPKVLRWAARPAWLQQWGWRPRPEPARFALGARVLALVDHANRWQGATVTAVRYEEAEWPEGYYAAYLVECDVGKKVPIPLDTDEYVRAPVSLDSPPACN